MKKTLKIAVLVDTSTGWSRRVIRGVSDYAMEQTGWQITVVESGINEKRGMEPGWQGDGVIARISDSETGHQLKEFGKPVVNVSGIELKGVDFPSVTSDYRALAGLAVQHFSERGYRQLAYYGLEDLPYVTRHCEAFVKVAEQQELSCAVYQPSQKPKASNWQKRQKSLIAWLNGLPKPIGIWTWGSMRGRSLLNACLEGGIIVPEQVAVLAGDDDDLLCQVCTPPLSGMVTPAEQIGYQAARMLHAFIEGEAPPEQKLLITEAEVNARASTETLAFSDPEVRKALHYIREHLQDQTLQVRDLAEALGLSRRALERRFELALGHGPSQEIQSARLKLVKKLLRETKMRISDLATRAGYTSPEYLGRVFKKNTGHTPRQFRLRQSEEQQRMPERA